MHQNVGTITMKVLMFGWEFPPVVSGGLGIACHGIVQGLLDKQVDVALVLPFLCEDIIQNSPIPHLHYISATQGDIDIKLIDTLLQPYMTPEYYTIKKNTMTALYGKDLYTEVHRYAHQAGLIARNTSHDVIHVHDWLTVLAGIEAKKISGKPLIFHIHALEDDRSPQNPNLATQAIERLGLHNADAIIAVSEYTKKRIIDIYHISPEKITVVYNGHLSTVKEVKKKHMIEKKQHTVLFLGRITAQKGPYYFIKAAEKILSIRQDVEFIIAGEGDQLPTIIETCARLGIAAHMHFPGFLDRAMVSEFYQLSDVYVMPSVSEPFGLVCLEAIAHDVPVVISKQSGVAEVLTHSLKVDYWDVDQLAANIMALLDYPALQKEMLTHAKRELADLTWDMAAEKIVHLYYQWV